MKISLSEGRESAKNCDCANADFLVEDRLVNEVDK